MIFVEKENGSKLHQALSIGIGVYSVVFQSKEKNNHTYFCAHEAHNKLDVPLCEITCVILTFKDPFNDWGGRGCNIFVPVLGGNGSKTAPTGDRFDQLPGQRR